MIYKIDKSEFHSKRFIGTGDLKNYSGERIFFREIDTLQKCDSI